MKEEILNAIAQDTALEILKRHAPDCLQRQGLRDAITQLARQGIESSVCLYQMQQRQHQAE